MLPASWLILELTTLGDISMKLLTDLFSTDYGLMSITGIAFMIGMGVFFLRLFTSKMNEDAKREDR